MDGATGDGVTGAEPLRLVLGFEEVAGGPLRIVLTDATAAPRTPCGVRALPWRA